MPFQAALRHAGISADVVLIAQEPFPDNTYLLPSDNAAQTWLKLSEKLEGTGYWPVIVGDADAIRIRREMLEIRESQDSATEIAKAAKFNFSGWKLSATKDVEPLDSEDTEDENYKDFLEFEPFEIDLGIKTKALETLVTSDEDGPLYLAIVECKFPSHIPALLHSETSIVALQTTFTSD